MRGNEENRKKQRSFSYKKQSYLHKRIFWGIIFIMPWLLGAVFFFLVPLFRTFYYSLFDMNLGTDGFHYVFNGIENFRYALTVDPDFYKNLIEAVMEAFSNVPVQIFVSLFVAMLLNGKYKGKGAFRLVFFVPVILATGITKLDIRGIEIVEEEAESVINTKAAADVLFMSGLPSAAIGFIMDFVESIFEVITTAGVQMLIFLSGLQGISPALYESAKIEGCTQFESFCKITLPMISPMILVCLVYSLADTFSRAGVTETISNVTFLNTRYGLGASMSTIYFFISMVVILLASYFVSKVVFYYDK